MNARRAFDLSEETDCSSQDWSSNFAKTNQSTDQEQRYSVISLMSPSMLPADGTQSKMDGQLPHHGSNCSEARKRRSDSCMALLALWTAYPVTCTKIDSSQPWMTKFHKLRWKGRRIRNLHHGWKRWIAPPVACCAEPRNISAISSYKLALAFHHSALWTWASDGRCNNEEGSLPSLNT